MRSVGMPITAAAWRSCAVACRASPVSVRVTNSQSAAKVARQIMPAMSCGWPMKIGPISTRPAASGLATVRKSGVHRNWAPARSAMASPNVPQTCASIGAPSSRRMIPKCTRTPAPPKLTATSGSEISGSSPTSDHSQNVANMASMRNSPCAKFTISISPKMRLKPTATRA